MRKEKPNSFRAYQLLQDGIIALSQVESVGMRVDVAYLDTQLESLPIRIRAIRDKLYTKDVWAIWRKRFREPNIGSGDQLAEVLYKILGYPVEDRTESGKPSTDIVALERIDLPFVKGLLRMQKLEKAYEVLQGIKREVVGDRLHPFFHLHTARTYRSSSSDPNFQNFPVRDPEISRIVRSVFIASEGCLICENDYKGVEVSVSACYHKDPKFIEYIVNPKMDMHRDMAAQLYMLEDDMAWMKANGKNHRYGAKNKFVFPEFYGDFYPRCAASLWEWMERAKLEAPGGISLKEHLKNRGIKSKGACSVEDKPVPGTFEFHVKEVENDFWNRRFMDYGQWKKDWYNAYLEDGGFETLTGFYISGKMDRNAVINYPVQGSAFHCLLWSLIRINKELRRRKMKSRVVGQIHDSIIGDVRVEELDEYLAIVHQITTTDIRKEWDWIIVPLSVEVELAAPSGTWFNKREVRYDAGKYSLEVKGEKEPRVFANGKGLIEFMDFTLQQEKKKEAA